MINRYSILNVAKNFSIEDGIQKYLVFQPVLKYFKPIKNNKAMTWKSLGLADKSIKPLTTTGNILVPRLDYFNNPKFRVEFIESCLKPER